ncbi:thioredoxin-like protein [Tribonema minus]|uniref:Thioredoxin-like protein n=1 Tax=Tribonema minus TaxID=303371 RepID=A0A835ZEG2_9STRA|nr:thioredoxin-like protein [Tribonema minus]
MHRLQLLLASLAAVLLPAIVNGFVGPACSTAAASCRTSSSPRMSAATTEAFTPLPENAAQIGVGDKIPSGTTVKIQGPDGSVAADVTELFKGKKVVLFGVPGAFTPTCSNNHLPGYVTHIDELKAKGVDTVACVSVNDIFVMKAWGESQSVSAKVVMLADGNGELSAALGLLTDKSGAGMGRRCKRFAMVVNDNVVKHIAVDTKGLQDSSAEAILDKL